MAIKTKTLAPSGGGVVPPRGPEREASKQGLVGVLSSARQGGVTDETPPRDPRGTPALKGGEGVRVVDRSEPVGSALRRMLNSGVWSVVVSEGGKPVGVLTGRDFVRTRLLRGCDGAPPIPVGEVATSPVGTAWKLMAEHNVRRVYVVECRLILRFRSNTELFQKLIGAFLTLPQLVSLR